MPLRELVRNKGRKCHACNKRDADHDARNCPTSRNLSSQTGEGSRAPRNNDGDEVDDIANFNDVEFEDNSDMEMSNGTDSSKDSSGGQFSFSFNLPSKLFGMYSVVTPSFHFFVLCCED